jgi:hypothetical protein
MPRREEVVFPPLIEVGLLVVAIVLLASLELHRPDRPPQS